MSDQATQDPGKDQDSTSQPDSATVEEVKNPEAVLAKNRELLGSIAKLKEQLSVFESEKKAAQEAKLAQEGKLEELLAAKEKELSDLSGKASKVDDYEKYFTDRLEEKMEGLSEAQKTLLINSNVSLAEKLKLAEELGSATTQKTSSPASSRPSGKNTSPAKFNLDDYKGLEGQKKLTALYYENRELYNEVIAARKNKL